MSKDKSEVGDVWRDVVGYEGKYQVNTKGEVRSLNYNRMNKTCLLKPYLGNRGYLSVVLSKGNKTKTKMVHKLVAESFIPNEDGKPFIDHINNIKTDNRVENLRWVTHKENMRNPLTRKRFSESAKKRPISENALKNRQRRIYCKELNKTFDSITQASKELNISIACICRVCSGNISHTRGYHFEYINIKEFNNAAED